jgi:anti-sigma factor RsiW
MTHVRSCVLLALSLVGCAATGSETPMTSVPRTPTTQRPAHERVVDAARADAARRSGLPAAQLAVVALESVTWADGSLGCPRPDMAYTQALVPGYRVRLQVGTEVWDYHASERGGVVLCPPGRSKEPGPSRRN